MDDNTRSSETAERFSTLLHETSENLPLDVGELVRGGLDRGRVRVRRQRRTVATSLAAAAVVGAVALATVVLPGFAGTSTRGVDPAGSGPVAAVSSTPHAGKPQPMAHGDIPVRAADLQRLFGKLYPGEIVPDDEVPGRITDEGRHGPAAAQWAQFFWNGYQTSVGFVAFPGTPLDQCERVVDAEKGKRNAPVVTCTPRADGSVLLRRWAMTGDEDPAARFNTRSATLLTTHGYEITVISYNIGRDHTPPLRVEPGFTMDQLTKAVTSQIWFTHR